jgi:hypothetical protein
MVIVVAELHRGTTPPPVVAMDGRRGDTERDAEGQDRGQHARRSDRSLLL